MLVPTHALQTVDPKFDELEQCVVVTRGVATDTGPRYPELAG